MTIELRLIGQTFDAHVEELSGRRGAYLWARTLWDGRDVVITATRWTSTGDHHVVGGEFTVATAPDEHVTTRGLAWVQAQRGRVAA